MSISICILCNEGGIIMTKRKIDFSDYANAITKALPNGILLTTKAEKVNSMVIGWGTIGVNWGKPVMAVYVREGRFSRKQLAQNPEFTISVPVGEFDKRILGICGGKSGRDTDKIAEAGLTLVDPEKISVPAVKELPLTLECKVMYVQKQDLTALSSDLLEPLYPQDVDSTATGCNKDPHVTFFGEIVDAYIIED